MNRKNRQQQPRYFRQLILAGLLSCLLVLNLTLASSQAQTLDQIAAIVNKEAILYSEVSQRAQFLLASQADARQLQRAALLEQALDELILERLQSQHAAERGVTVDDAMLNRALESIASNNQMDLPAFQQAVQAEGIDFAAFREQTRRKILADTLRRQQITERIQVSEREVADLIGNQGAQLVAGEAFRLQHILINAPNGTPIEQVNIARQRAEELQRRLTQGENFEAIARQFSDNQAAAQGGDLGWQRAESLPASFVRALVLMQANAISEVVRDAQGFHILRLLERRGNSQAGASEELKKRAVEFIGKRKEEEQYRAWLQSLRNSAYIEYRLPNRATNGLKLQ